MRPLAMVAVLALVALPVAAQQSPPPPPSVHVGQPAPDFTLKYLGLGPNGAFEQKSVSLTDFKGKKSVILVFFPAAFSPG
jgi:hypothetical protein